MRAFVLVLVLCAVVASALNGPTKTLSAHSVDQLVKLVTAKSTQSVSEAFFAVRALQGLGKPIANGPALCSLVERSLASPPSAMLAHQSVAVAEALKCGSAASAAMQELLRTSLASTTLGDVAHAVKAIALLKAAGHSAGLESSLNAQKVLDSLVDQVDADGMWPLEVDEEEVSVTGSGVILQALATLVSDFGAKKPTAVLESLTDLLVSAEEDNDQVYFVENHQESSSSLANFRATTEVFLGLHELVKATQFALADTREFVTGVTEYLLQHQQVGTAEQAALLVLSLKAASQHALHTPLALTLTTSSLTLGQTAPLKVRVSDVLGGVPSGAVSVSLVRAHPYGDEKKVLAKDTPLTPAADSSFEINLLAQKPEQGWYIATFAVTSKSSNYLSAEYAHLVKVVVDATIKDFSISVSQSEFRSAGASATSVAFGSTLTAAQRLTVHEKQFLHIDFKVVSKQGGQSVRVHQAFVKLTHVDSGHEAIFMSTYEDGAYSVSVGSANPAVGSRTGAWALELIVGDSCLSNPFSWKVGSVTFDFGANARVDKPSDAFSPRPEIVHKYREPEKRPAESISRAFTILSLAPLAVLFLGWIAVGANLRNFPTGAVFLPAVVFNVSLALLFLNYAGFFFAYNLVQTLYYLAIIAVPLFLSGYMVLRHMVASSSATKLKKQ